MYGRPSGRPLTETRDYAAHTKKGKLRGQMATELGFGGGEHPACSARNLSDAEPAL